MIEWNKLYDAGNDYKQINAREITSFLHLMKSPTRNNIALDIGCGTGHLTRELWHGGLKPTGIDISESAIDRARTYTTLDTDQIQYIVVDIENDGIEAFDKKVFDLITCKLVYAFIIDKQTFLGNVSKLLSDDGIFVIIAPLKQDLPEEKKGIGIDYNQTTTELLAFFDIKSSEKENGNVTFICHAK